MNPTREQLIAAGMSEEAADRVLAALEQMAAAEAAAAKDGAAANGEAKAAEAAETAPDAAKAAAAETEPATAEAAAAEDGAAANGEAKAAEAAESAPDAAAIEAENQRLRAQLADALVAQAAMRLGVKPERVGTLRRLTDLSQIDPASEDLAAQVEKAVEAALKEVPELAATAAGTGSLGNHPRWKSESANDRTAAAFRAGMAR